jgi:hypothetical protein
MEELKDSEIMEFIHRRFSTLYSDCFLCGNCYYFALILNHRFPQTKIIYLPIRGHFCVQNPYTNNCFDIQGIVDLNNEPIYDWNKLKIEEFNIYSRIYIDCIE